MRVTKNSRPAILRLIAPGSFFSSMFSCVSFHSSTWCSNITARSADLDLQLGHQLAADVVGDAREGLVVDARRDRLGQVHGAILLRRAGRLIGIAVGARRALAASFAAGPDGAGRVAAGVAPAPASALDWLYLAPGRGFSSPKAAATNYAGISRSWPAETFESLSPSPARSASIATTRRTRASATTPTGSRCASTAAGVASTPAIGRPASAGALLWPVTANVQSSAATRPCCGRRPRLSRARRAPREAEQRRAERARARRRPGRARPRLRRRRRVRRRARRAAPAACPPSPTLSPRAKSRRRRSPRAISPRTHSRSSRARPAPAAAAGPVGGGGGSDDGGVGPEQASGAPLRGGNRAIGFLRASWAELQRVQWPDRRQVTQATAVVLGFVAIAGAYLGLADYVAKEIVEFIL